MDKKKITSMEVKKKNRNDIFRYICRQGTVSKNTTGAGDTFCANVLGFVLEHGLKVFEEKFADIPRCNCQLTD